MAEKRANDPTAIVQRLPLSRRDHRSLRLGWLRCSEPVTFM